MEFKLQYNKRIPVIRDFLRYYFASAYNLKRMARASSRYLNHRFTERIMLAVTEVNGCKLCAQGHAKMALKSGLSEKEIQDLLSDDKKLVPEHEGVAILYATHFADTGGRTDKDTDRRLFETYGSETARGIIAAIDMIMLGNAVGIIYGCFTDRLSGKANSESSLVRELLIFILLIALLPLYLIVVLMGIIFN